MIDLDISYFGNNEKDTASLSLWSLYSSKRAKLSTEKTVIQISKHLIEGQREPTEVREWGAWMEEFG